MGFLTGRKKFFTYHTGNITIKSEKEITEEKIRQIERIVEITMVWYRSNTAYHEIAKRIYHEVMNQNGWVYVKHNFNKIVIKLMKN